MGWRTYYNIQAIFYLTARLAGILLFWLSMVVYSTGEHARGYKQGFDDGIKKCIEILEKE